jgi:HTH-type transcriptional regulator, sugar sensing transcriptional regulator
MSQQVRERKTLVDLALGVESHVKRHLIYLATAQRRIWSYLESGDLAAIETITASGFPILRRISRSATERKLDHQMVFGFAYQNATDLVAFLRRYRNHLEHVTGVRYSGELGHPFHVVDDDIVIYFPLTILIPEGRFAGTRSWPSVLPVV